MTTKEISRFMEVSVNTITSRLQRARKRLQTDHGPLIQEFFGHPQLSENLKENIMRQLEEIRSKFNSFMEQVKANPASREDILKEAHNEIEDALKDGITPGLVRLAVDDIYPYMGKLGMEKRVSLLRRYMDDALEDTERYWAHEALVYSLAFLERNREAIEEHSRLYQWTCQHLPDKYVLEIAANLSVAGCWATEGRLDDWIQLYNGASGRLENPDVSYYSRCGFLQTGADVLRGNTRFDEALLEIEKLERANNDLGSEHYFQFWFTARTNRLLVYGRQEDRSRFDQVFTELSAYMEGELKKRDAGQPVNLGNLIWLAHDVGCCLVWLKKYNEAKRFLQIAIDLEDGNDYRHFQLSVSIWASEKDREKTLHHLKVAQNYYVLKSYNYQDTYYPTFLETAEFSDVKDDEAFLKVLGQT
jgi:tetratricopeptide (TPR) repeat protein